MSGKNFFSGDVHGFEFDRFFYKNNPWLRDLAEDDTLIVLGDWSVPWNESTKSYDKFWLNWFNERSWTTLVIAGNHDNYWKYNSYPNVLYSNGNDTSYTAHCNPDYPKIRYITEPEYFTLNDTHFFACPGADSQDISDGILDPSKPDYKQHKHDLKIHGRTRFRTLGVDWWSEEKIDIEKAESLAGQLMVSDVPVDIILSHDVPSSYLKYGVDGRWFKPNDGELCLEKVRQMLQPKYHLCGHLHQEASVYDSRLDVWTVEMYNSIVPEDELNDWTKEHKWE